MKHKKTPGHALLHLIIYSGLIVGFIALFFIIYNLLTISTTFLNSPYRFFLYTFMILLALALSFVIFFVLYNTTEIKKYIRHRSTLVSIILSFMITAFLIIMNDLRTSAEELAKQSVNVTTILSGPPVNFLFTGILIFILMNLAFVTFSGKKKHKHDLEHYAFWFFVMLMILLIIKFLVSMIK